MNFNPRYPLKHLSVRVPWHDNNWNGTICNNPKNNSACLALRNCALGKDDEKEQKLAGQSLKVLNEPDYPPCVDDRVTFMAPFSIPRTLKHPYVKSSPSTHGHLKDTKVQFPAFSAPAIPYHWMLKGNAKEKAETFALAFDEGMEPNLDFKGSDNWVQEFNNQKALLNCFFGHFKEETSLVFFYAKQVPFVEDNGRVLVGAGRISKIIDSDKYDGSNKRFSAAYWEHMVMHTIREGKGDGFLLPYQEAIDFQVLHPNFDPATIAVMTPADKRFEFSYAAEHVSNDSAIRVLLDCMNAFELAESNGFGEKNNLAIQWIHNEIAKLEKLRGDYPGMGSALCAFGISKGHFVAAEITNEIDEQNRSPWELFALAIKDSKDILSDSVAAQIGFNTKKLYENLARRDNKTRIDLLHLLSRFDLSQEQTVILFIAEERIKNGILRADTEYLENPFLIYEDLRRTTVPVALSTIDLGLYLKKDSSEILPVGMLYDDPFHNNRVRALTILQLELAALNGHTLLPQRQIINQIRELPLHPACPINSDYFELAEESFTGAIISEEMKNGDRAYQLERFAKSRKIISEKITARVNSAALSLDADWQSLLATALQPFTKGTPDSQEIKAREEKAAALKKIAESRFSVLIGPAGTGKTTLLTILAGQPEIENNGVLLLAPTGKARVRMEEVAKDLNVTAKTLAQFLSQYNRYEGSTQQYLFSDQNCESTYETVILDEASMLTEEMLATTLDCLTGVKRFILVGDHRQLPPIGAGRPFVDIINYLRPEGIETSFPRVGKGYAELTIKRRQGGSGREDLMLAEWFSGESLEPGADEIINKILTKEKSDYLRIEHWNTEHDFEALFEKVLVEELGLKDITDTEAFNRSLGSPDGKYFNFKEAIKMSESWQILSPVRDRLFGVKAVNRLIHQHFRKDKIDYAHRWDSIIPLPIGLEQIVYGDKVINLYNARRWHGDVWPQENALNYTANGEIGIVIGQKKTKNHTFKGRPQNTEVEFSTQKNYKYTFRAKEFSEDGDIPLELAYALTVHKAQGSEFGTVFLIVPNPCLLLTREMLYTALTRQKNRVILLFQGETFDIKDLASPLRSDTLKRITNLFVKPELVEIDGKYLEKNLIHQASDGNMLRSKSEQLIYQRLLDKGLKPLYEKKLIIKGVEKLPDFTIENDDTGQVYYWEHCGMLFDKEYNERWGEKYAWYLENDILPADDGGGKNGTLIVSEDKGHVLENGTIRGAISIMEIDEMIAKIFNR